ncbi:MAG: hypothetical protein ACHRXM_07800 [Isosphaerales bacterium]
MEVCDTRDVFPQTTRLNHLSYCFTPKHHGAGLKSDACWLPDLPRPEEFAVFDMADWHLQVKSPDFPGRQVTWAGEFPWTHDLCFGTEDGSIGVRDVNGVEISCGPIIESGEAINGVAFSRNMVAISTRGELLINRHPFPGGPQTTLYNGGAHGVVATGSGGFLAPAGSSGLIQVELLPDGSFRHREFRGRDAELYFYRMARLGRTDRGDEVFACAGRNDGLMAITIKSDGIPSGIAVNKGFITTGDENIDIVDVCRLPSLTHPFASASLGIDNSLHLSHDIRREHAPLGLCFQEMEETAYNVLSAQGHIFILTSDAFYFLPKLADRFLSGEPIRGGLTVRRFPVEALDASIAYAEHLMLIVARSVLLLEISKLPAAFGLDDSLRSRLDVESSAPEPNEMVPDLDASAWSPRECAVVAS